MFSKLLKHEWKATSGLLIILSLCALGVGAMGGGMLRLLNYVSEHMLDNGMAAIATSGLSSMLFFLMIALVAYILAVQFITLFRFYKNKFTDEGYLTFTLPVTTHQIFLSSFLNILIWLVISVVVLMLSGLLMLLIGVGDPLLQILEALREVTQSLGALFSDWELPGAGALMTFALLHIPVMPVYNIVLLMTSITLGCVLAKKHKILATIGMYYCIHMGVNMLSSILSVVPTLLMIGGTLSNPDHYVGYVAFPEDAHMPGRHLDVPNDFVKVVVKLKV